MPLDWSGDDVVRKVRRAEVSGVDTTMAACVLHAKDNHGPGAHSSDRFETQTGALERSLRIVEPAEEIAGGARGVWGSTELAYAHRIEFGYQGKDAFGNVVTGQAFPYLIPAAAAEYPKLPERIRRAM